MLPWSNPEVVDYLFRHSRPRVTRSAIIRKFRRGKSPRPNAGSLDWQPRCFHTRSHPSFGCGDWGKEKAGGGEPTPAGENVEVPKRQRLGSLAETESGRQRSLKPSLISQAVFTSDSEGLI